MISVIHTPNLHLFLPNGRWLHSDSAMMMMKTSMFPCCSLTFSSSLFSLSPSASETTVCSTTSSWRTIEMCTTPPGPVSSSTWRAPDRCSQRVRTCRRPPSFYPRRTRCRWSVSCCTGRRETRWLIPPTRTTSTRGKRRKAPIPRPCMRTTPTWR